jgi:hypothetical protein
MPYVIWSGPDSVIFISCTRARSQPMNASASSRKPSRSSA